MQLIEDFLAKPSFGSWFHKKVNARSAPVVASLPGQICVEKEASPNARECDPGQILRQVRGQVYSGLLTPGPGRMDTHPDLGARF